MSRIDTPRPLKRLPAGQAAVAGVAWAQHRGIRRVEVRADGGPWRAARLAAEHSADTWRQWVWPWEATPGTHKTLQGDTLKITGTGEDFKVNGRSSVVCGNVQTANATVYIIDGVLTPMS